MNAVLSFIFSEIYSTFGLRVLLAGQLSAKHILPVLVYQIIEEKRLLTQTSYNERYVEDGQDKIRYYYPAYLAIQLTHVSRVPQADTARVQVRALYNYLTGESFYNKVRNQKSAAVLVTSGIRETMYATADGYELNNSFDMNIRYSETVTTDSLGSIDTVLYEEGT